MTKQEIFLKDIIFPHIPTFSDPAVQKHYLEMANRYPKSVNVEHLTEIALAIRGGYNFVDTEAKDFDDVDQSDSKTVSILYSSKQIFLGSIAKKIGALRISIFNPYHSKVDFMFIPYGQWQRMAKACHGENTEGKLRLIMRYNDTKDTYNQYEKFRLKTFEELATATSADFYTKFPYLLEQESVPETTFGNLFGDSTDFLQDQYSPGLTKIDPIQEISSLCTQLPSEFQNQDQRELQPSVPYVKS